MPCRFCQFCVLCGRAAWPRPSGLPAEDCPDRGATGPDPAEPQAPPPTWSCVSRVTPLVAPAPLAVALPVRDEGRAEQLLPGGAAVHLDLRVLREAQGVVAGVRGAPAGPAGRRPPPGRPEEPRVRRSRPLTCLSPPPCLNPSPPPSFVGFVHFLCPIFSVPSTYPPLPWCRRWPSTSMAVNCYPSTALNGWGEHRAN